MERFNRQRAGYEHRLKGRDSEQACVKVFERIWKKIPEYHNVFRVFNANLNFPDFINCIRITQIDQLDRHIVSDQDLNVSYLHHY